MKPAAKKGDHVVALDTLLCWAAIYRQLRHERIVYSENEFAAVAYHVMTDLDGAVAL